MTTQALLLVLALVSASKLSAQPVEAVDAVELYYQYARDYEKAEAKYAGKLLAISGRVIGTTFVDNGLGHLRVVWLATDNSMTMMKSIMVCFTESCSDVRQPTVSDAEFRSIKAKSRLKAVCVVERSAPNKYTNERVGPFLSACAQ